ncbi:MAG TPA: hypothetical protein VGG32_11160 [Thermoplasmata archaeon]|jgi:hypothetical protein
MTRYCRLSEHKGAKVPAKAYLVRVYDEEKQTELSTGVRVVLCEEHWNDLKRTILLGWGEPAP